MDLSLPLFLFLIEAAAVGSRSSSSCSISRHPFPNRILQLSLISTSNQQISTSNQQRQIPEPTHKLLPLQNPQASEPSAAASTCTPAGRGSPNTAAHGLRAHTGTTDLPVRNRIFLPLPYHAEDPRGRRAARRREVRADGSGSQAVCDGVRQAAERGRVRGIRGDGEKRSRPNAGCAAARWRWRWGSRRWPRSLRDAPPPRGRATYETRPPPPPGLRRSPPPDPHPSLIRLRRSSGKEEKGTGLPGTGRKGGRRRSLHGATPLASNRSKPDGTLFLTYNCSFFLRYSYTVSFSGIFYQLCDLFFLFWLRVSIV
jgi:hypothetical protein